jgi:putative endopeptidase
MRALKSLLLAAACAVPLSVLATAQAPKDDGLHADWIDKSVDPAQDFFHYANGDWLKANPIPGDHSSWGSFDILYDHNQDVLKQVVESAAKDKKAKQGSDTQKVADFYAAGMDEKAIEAAGAKPLDDELARITGIKDAQGLEDEVAHLHMMGVGVMFRFGESQDLHDSSKVIGAAYQGGLGLPDRDYYVKTADKCVAPASASGTAPVSATSAAAQAAEAAVTACKAQADHFQKIRDAYTAHMTAMFQLLGDPADKAAAESATVMKIETALAAASMTRVERRNPDNSYHITDLAGLKTLTPDFAWDRYFSDVGHPELASINVGQPDFFKALDGQLTQVSIADWQTYLRWHLVDDSAPYLSKAFVDEDFKMNSMLSGATELEPRWKRVLATEDQLIGFAMGKLYVAKAFPPSSKKQVLAILHAIRGALHDDLSTLAWMSPATRTAAQEKLKMIEERIGYPDKWRDYSSLTVTRSSYVGNVMAASAFLQKRELNKIGKPVDLTEWGMTPPTVNAYYSSQRNNINFPAGILQPPFFDPKATPAVNFGSLGFVMGHEITHGFDDQGAQFDGRGNRMAKPGWWTDEDFAKFQKATDCISDHFSQYTIPGGAHVQGHLVTGEATADLGGLTLAWRAYHASKYYKVAKKLDGYTPDQQFFLGAAHVWAESVRPERQQQLVTVDPHPPAIYRVNGTLANMPQFQKTWNVPDDSPMVNKDRCVIW